MIIIKLPRDNKIHSYLTITTFFPFDSLNIINKAKKIIASEHKIGAITGPTQATGSRNNKSHVKTDSGQPNRSFRNT